MKLSGFSAIYLPLFGVFGQINVRIKFNLSEIPIDFCVDLLLVKEEKHVNMNYLSEDFKNKTMVAQ